MNRNLVIGIVVIGVVLVGAVGVWYVKSSADSQIVSPKTETIVETGPEPTEEVGSGEIKEVVVEASDFKFVPAIITVKKGDTISLTFKSVGGMHDFVIDEFDVKTNQIGDEEEETVEFVADKVGTYEYYCSVGKHREMGMVGKLVVE